MSLNSAPASSEFADIDSLRAAFLAEPEGPTIGRIADVFVSAAAAGDVAGLESV